MKSQPKTLLCLIFLVVRSLNLQSQSVTDYDGNVYQTAPFGNQIWMTENLRTTHYSDGSSPEDGSTFDYYSLEVAMDGSDSTKYYFYYNNDSTYAKDYGCLYNWFAAVNGTNGNSSNPSGIQGVCPTGWHIPSISEWDELIDFVGDNSGLILQQDGTSAFHAELGGNRHDLANEFRNINTSGAYISSSVEPDGYIALIVFNLNDNQTQHWYHRKTSGYSVRCIKDTQTSVVLKHDDKSNYSMYPNPCNEYFYINSNNLKINIINIFSIEGKLMKSIIFQRDTRISVVDIDNGLYIITLYTDNNIYTKKLMIK